MEVSIIRIKKREQHFVVLDKQAIQNKRLSWRARGMLAYFLSLPDDWEVKIPDLINRSPDGKHIVYETIKELKKFGYITLETRRKNGKIVSKEYVVHEIPEQYQQDVDQKHLKHQNSDFLDTEFQDEENQDQENQTLLNNNINKYTKKKITTAADKDSDISQPCLHSITPNAAVSFFDKSKILKGKDLVIDSVLSENQTNYLSRILENITEGAELESLISEVEYTLLDSESFTLAGSDFVKKLNSILKVIRAGQWTTPATFITKEKQQQQNHLNDYQQKLNELLGEQHTLKQFINFSKQKQNQTDVDRYSSDLEKVDSKILQLRGKFGDQYGQVRRGHQG